MSRIYLWKKSIQVPRSRRSWHLTPRRHICHPANDWLIMISLIPSRWAWTTPDVIAELKGKYMSYRAPFRPCAVRLARLTHEIRPQFSCRARARACGDYTRFRWAYVREWKSLLLSLMIFHFVHALFSILARWTCASFARGMIQRWVAVSSATVITVGAERGKSRWDTA